MLAASPTEQSRRFTSGSSVSFARCARPSPVLRGSELRRRNGTTLVRCAVTPPRTTSADQSVIEL
jgi:hypothetical protein